MSGVRVGVVPGSASSPRLPPPEGHWAPDDPLRISGEANEHMQTIPEEKRKKRSLELCWGGSPSVSVSRLQKKTSSMTDKQPNN